MQNLFKALAAAQGELEHAKKDSLNPHYKSKYADLAACLDAIKGPFAKHGLCVTQLVGHENGVPTLKTILAHSSGEYIESTMVIVTTKNDVHGLGSGITYARRYALCAITGLGADDDDGNGAAGSPTGTTGATGITGSPERTTGVTKYTGKPEQKLYVQHVIKKLGAEHIVKSLGKEFGEKLAKKSPKMNEGDIEAAIHEIIQEAADAKNS